MIHTYAAAQQGSPSPGHLFGWAAGFLLAGSYLMYRARRLKGGASRLGHSGAATGTIAFGRRAYLASAWVCLTFGALCLVTAVGVALTN
jgi:hypothetical protein